MTADLADHSSMIDAPLRFRRRHVVCLVIDPKESKLWRASFKGHYPIFYVSAFDVHIDAQNEYFDGFCADLCTIGLFQARNRRDDALLNGGNAHMGAYSSKLLNFLQ
jgi:hypothetical protein